MIVQYLPHFHPLTLNFQVLDEGGGLSNTNRGIDTARAHLLGVETLPGREDLSFSNDALALLPWFEPLMQKQHLRILLLVHVA